MLTHYIEFSNILFLFSINMLALLLLYLLFSFIHCNNESRSSEDTEPKVNTDLEVGNDETRIESCGKNKGIKIRKHLEVCVGSQQALSAFFETFKCLSLFII